MDITILFKACVKTVRTTNKALGLQESKPALPKSGPKDPNLATAKEVVKQITHFQTFLLENKAAYLNVLNYLSTNKTMTEVDREQIDTTAEKIVTTCTSLISDYKKEICKLPKSKQKEEHYHNVIDSLERYLKTVSKIYTEAKAIRVKRVLETHKVAKLETIGSKGSLEPPIVPPVSPPPVDIEDQLSVEEMQMFESENEMLYNELNSTSEEVKQMESKVVHIAELQELFTEKVLQQEQDIERIANNVVGATSNMRDANEQIRQAIQRNAGLRVWVLFFLLVMSFSLLFLDWYND
ncbi:syntaxin-18 [Tribolium castaneum]|uniref:Syntaxin-18 n=1 Tax=Tribolium castaneum TaxID=7070 RepID=D6X505_TRICA|nr:PREDICTED: syntaxin-18 [Tribolium castaneum]XP_969961.1 PREDICTED: syntaxin-18 [Tribolium castaneum]EEZ97605.1 Syntaxin-18-like Protein [Tribolium castaneum]|eukprot:XP_008198938.1 PREDICTED: syntaxin-18 [Tribolium castaneum]